MKNLLLLQFGAVVANKSLDERLTVGEDADRSLAGRTCDSSTRFSKNIGSTRFYFPTLQNFTLAQRNITVMPCKSNKTKNQVLGCYVRCEMFGKRPILVNRKPVKTKKLKCQGKSYKLNFNESIIEPCPGQQNSEMKCESKCQFVNNKLKIKKTYITKNDSKKCDPADLKFGKRLFRKEMYKFQNTEPFHVTKVQCQHAEWSTYLECKDGIVMDNYDCPQMSQTSCPKKQPIHIIQSNDWFKKENLDLDFGCMDPFGYFGKGDEWYMKTFKCKYPNQDGSYANVSVHYDKETKYWTTIDSPCPDKP